MLSLCPRSRWCHHQDREVRDRLLSFLRRNNLPRYRKMIKTNLREQALVTLAEMAV
jgi:hypothetical protein